MLASADDQGGGQDGGRQRGFGGQQMPDVSDKDCDAVKAALRDPVIFDGRNLYDPKLLERRGIRYYAIGRGRSASEPKRAS